MKIFILQPPITQLNTPYPSGAYLASFFRNLQNQNQYNISSVQWFDLNIALFEKIFSQTGIKRIFELAQNQALKKADLAEKKGNTEEAFQLRRYIINQDSWIQWIDRIRSILCGCSKDSSSKIFGRELCQEFVFSPFSPRGNRMENFLESLNRAPTDDDALGLATFALADLADFINVSLDSNFELVRYAEHLTASIASFDTFLNELNSPILTNFLSPIIDSILKNLLKNDILPKDKKETILFCISIPFPGCFVPSIFLAKQIKLWSKNNDIPVIISIGGGYCSTELRETEEKRLNQFVDIISYDRGYASYKELLSRLVLNNENIKKTLSTPISEARIFTKEKILFQSEENDELKNQILKTNIEFTQNTFPDYTDIDFSRYPRLADDENPMHRLWSCGSWLKAYLAHGCYWHRCAFCDTTLDYVCGYKKVSSQKLYKALYEQAKKTGIYGIHFVDEAAPPTSLQEFALLNCVEKNHLTFWGNIRFEKTFSRDLTDLLSFGGLTGVSGGIEIATGKGLESVNKGTDIDSIVSALCAFKESGVMIHAYMIFGFYDQTEQDLINSMETLRQLFENGLIDSSFFHKFVLTRHSTVFAEWKKGKHPNLHPILSDKKANNALFAMNDIRFDGEEKSVKYAQPLENAVSNWMHGQGLNEKVTNFFDYKMPSPSISKDFIAEKIQNYEIKRNQSFNDYDDFINGKAKYIWLGGTPIIIQGKTIQWNYMQEVLQANTLSGENLTEYLKSISVKNYFINSDIKKGIMKDELQEIIPRKLYKKLRGNGLCRCL